MDFRTFYTGSMWWVQTLSRIVVSLLIKTVNPAPATPVGVPLKMVVAAQMIATTGTEVGKTASLRVFPTNSRGNQEVHHVVDRPDLDSHWIGETITTATQTYGNSVYPGFFDRI
jgi:hypothetical protein